MSTTTAGIRYIIYARKSSESEDKQVQSIDDQVRLLSDFAARLGLRVVDTISESKSARAPHKREAFAQMLERIERGEADGIIAWKLDRLSRNPVDSGRLQWMLQESVIRSIRTPEREHLPEDNGLPFGVESSMANQFVRDLSKNVKRGLQSKRDKGWMPGSAPLGYLNTKTQARGENYIIKDPERFPLVRRAWDLMLSGAYTPPAILERLNNEWGFRTRQTRRTGGKPMSRSTIYRILTNPFYAGIIEYKGLSFPGKHEPMVTIEEYDLVQKLLGRDGRPRPKRYEYAFTGLVQCGDCGGTISATFKEKALRLKRELKSYTLYYCTCARRKGAACAQRHYTNADELEKQIEREISTFTILPEFRGWALKVLAEKHATEASERTTLYEAQQRAASDTQKQLDTLTGMRMRDLINDAEYMTERTRLQSELTRLRIQTKDTERRADDWLELTEQAFDFACYAHKAFLYGDAKTKREILSTIVHLNCTMSDHKLKIDAMEWLVPIKKRYPALETKIKAFEPEIYGSAEWEKTAFAAFSPDVRGRPDLNR